MIEFIDGLQPGTQVLLVIGGMLVLCIVGGGWQGWPFKGSS